LSPTLLDDIVFVTPVLYKIVALCNVAVSFYLSCANVLYVVLFLKGVECRFGDGKL